MKTILKVVFVAFLITLPSFSQNIDTIRVDRRTVIFVAPIKADIDTTRPLGGTDINGILSDFRYYAEIVTPKLLKKDVAVFWATAPLIRIEGPWRSTETWHRSDITLNEVVGIMLIEPRAVPTVAEGLYTALQLAQLVRESFFMRLE